MFGYNPYGYGYGLLSQMPTLQAPQVVQQPILSAARGIGTSLPEYRQMSPAAYALNVINQANPNSFGPGGVVKLADLLFKTTSPNFITSLVPQALQDNMLETVRNMSPEEYKKFAVYK